jgi:aerobic carbon-monoxide dehydrogenase large subunit
MSGGFVSVIGSPASRLSTKEIARLTYTDITALPPDQPLGLEAYTRYTPSSHMTWSNACHLCACEVDPSTGRVQIIRCVVSEDCGVMINPNVVESQITGGVVQGIGGVLYEHMKYDPEGNPLATTFLDYLLPTSTEVPTLEYGHIETPSTVQSGRPQGSRRGRGDRSSPAVINAIADALAPLGIKVTDQPLDPVDVSRLIESAAAKAILGSS